MTRTYARWVNRAAHAVPLCVLPSALWRLAMGAGVPVGYSEQVLRDDFGIPGWGAAYVIGLSVLTECLALLTFALIRPWGEVLPRRLPLLGGRRVPPRLLTAAGATVAVLITLLAASQLWVWFVIGADGRLGDTALTVMGLCYLPLVAWGPLVGAVTYARRTAIRAMSSAAAPPCRATSSSSQSSSCSGSAKSAAVSRRTGS
jgi:hypothetical protein